MTRIIPFPVLCLVVMGCLFPMARAENATNSNPALPTVLLEVKQDIEKDTEALNRLREELDAQRTPLAEQLDRLRRQVAEQRSEAERIQRLRRQGEDDRAALQQEVAALEDENRFLLSVFSEYARAMETRVGTAESARLSERLRAIDALLVEDDSFAQLPQGVDALLRLSAQWNHDRLGGMLIDGTALDLDGREHTGRFAVFGPVAYFAAETGSLAGLPFTKFGSLQPCIYVPPEADRRRAIAGLAQGREAQVPVDVTRGDALRITEARTTFIEHIRKGGFVIVPLLAVGGLALILIVWKTVELCRIRVRGGEALRPIMDLARGGDVDGATRLAAGLREPLASLVNEAIIYRNASREHLEEIMHEHVLASQPRMERHLGTLAVLGGIAPLLGLLGTVTGMIHTFQMVTLFGTGDAKLLSGGISEALVTTEFGLVIAIPVLLAHAFLARRARGILSTLEQTALGMVNELKVRGPNP
ncbi:MAG: MotA/TolQ/ExbB proton channel family protein [Spartobacteria bacterium]|nr:MotA/TolQ/ExbB proton channel family protein [Spartobacteria bacterium]